MNALHLEHPDAESLLAYGLGKLDEAASAQVYQHLEACDRCCSCVEIMADDTLAALVRMSATPLEDAFSPPLPNDLPCAAREPADPPALADHPRYRVLELLGHGGMGAVYRAEHRLMERTVALKVIKHELTDRPTVVERFRREVRAAARLDHPNIVHAYDAERAGDTHFLVLEYVEGITLARLVSERGPLPVTEACACIRQAALGLQHAFEHGMVHRDIKPQNLMVTTEGTVKILDFGLARLISELAPPGAVTDSGVVLGTADYIAPEQADDPHAADTRADIYALGCTLYFLLTGQPPFPEGTLMQKLLAHGKHSPRPVAEFRTDLPPGLVAVLDRMTAKDPAQRYQMPGQVAHALAPFLEAPSSAAVATTAEAVRPAHRKSRSRRRWSAVAAGLVLLLLGGGLFGVGASRIATDKGEFVVEVDDPKVEVLLAKQGLTVIDKATGHRYILKPGRHDLRSGDYEIDVTEQEGGLQLSTREFRIARGGAERVKVTLEPSVIAVGEVRRFEGHAEAVHAVAFSPDGRLAASGGGGDGIRGSGSDHAVRLWELKTGKELHRFEGHTAAVLSVAFSPDGRQLASAAGGADATIRLWDVIERKPLACLRGHRPGQNRLEATFSPDGRRLLSAGWDGTLRLWDVATGKEIRQFGENLGWHQAAFFPDGRRAVCCGVTVLAIYDTETGKKLQRFDVAGERPRFSYVAVSPDGRHILSTSGHDGASSSWYVRLWDVKTGRVVWDQRASGSVAFSPDGRRALSGTDPAGSDPIARLWDVETGKLLHRFAGHTAWITNVAFSPDGRYVLSASNDRTVRLWRLPDPSSQKKVGK